MKHSIFSAIIGILFFVMIVGGCLLGIIVPDKDFSETENRMLQKFPIFSIGNYIDGRFEEKTEKYFDDQFLFRDTFIHIKTSADLAMGKVESNEVFLGKDGYLLEGLSTPTDEWMDKTTSGLEDFRKKYPNIEMSFMLVPNAANILSDKMPKFSKQPDQNKYMDKFNSIIKDSNYQIIDVRDTFKENSDKQLYYRTDHHWTSHGAYVAFKEAAKVLKLNIDTFTPYVVKGDFRGTLASKSGFTNGVDDAITLYLPNKDDYLPSVIRYADTKKKTTTFFEMDNLEKKDAYTVFGGSNHPLYTINTPTKSNEKLLIVKDSYGRKR